MIRRRLGNLISVLFTLIKFSLMKIGLGSKFHFKWIERFSPDVVTEFNRGATVILGSNISVHSGTKIKARPNSKLIIGNGVKINYNCIVVCRNRIEIGKGTEFGPSVYIYDHDHDFSVGLKKGEMTNDIVHIGENCWIGANTVILKGTIIGDNSVIGAGSIVKGQFPANSVIIQKRETTIKDL